MPKLTKFNTLFKPGQTDQITQTCPANRLLSLYGKQPHTTHHQYWSSWFHMYPSLLAYYLSSSWPIYKRTHTNMYISTQTQTHVPCVYNGINALPTHWFVRPCCITNASPVACFANSVGKTPLLLQQIIISQNYSVVNNWRQESCRVCCIDISKLLSSHPGFLNVFHLGNLKRPENHNLTLVKLHFQR